MVTVFSGDRRNLLADNEIWTAYYVLPKKNCSTTTYVFRPEKKHGKMKKNKNICTTPPCSISCSHHPHYDLWLPPKVPPFDLNVTDP